MHSPACFRPNAARHSPLCCTDEDVGTLKHLAEKGIRSEHPPSPPWLPISVIWKPGRLRQPALTLPWPASEGLAFVVPGSSSLGSGQTGVRPKSRYAPTVVALSLMVEMSPDCFAFRAHTHRTLFVAALRSWATLHRWRGLQPVLLLTRLPDRTPILAVRAICSVNPHARATMQSRGLWVQPAGSPTPAPEPANRSSATAPCCSLHSPLAAGVLRVWGAS